MKNILHFQINLNKDKPEIISKFMEITKSKLSDDWDVICSPYIPSQMKLEDQNMVLYNFDMKQITLDQLKKMMGE